MATSLRGLTPESDSGGDASPSADGQPPLAVYTMVPSHRLYGGESMALATLDGLRPHFRTLLLAPPGLSHERAAQLGIASEVFEGRLGFALAITRILLRERNAALMTTAVEHSLATAAVNLVLGRRLAHLHLGHGGPEPEAYRRKPWLNRFPVRFVAVSDYARERLLAYGVDESKVAVIPNFLDSVRARRLSQINHPPAEPARRVLVLSRLVPLKRPGLIFDAIEAAPRLRELEFRIVGEGPMMESLRARAEAFPNVALPGFSYDIEAELAAADVLVHPCPVETFGLVVLEGMQAGLPVLVPDRGGAADLVGPGFGFRFETDSAVDLAARLLEIVSLPAPERVAIGERARLVADERFGQKAASEQYRDLINELLLPPRRTPRHQSRAPSPAQGLALSGTPESAGFLRETATLVLELLRRIP